MIYFKGVLVGMLAALVASVIYLLAVFVFPLLLPFLYDLERLKERYFLRFPDGRDRQTWPGLTYVRARPKWIRFSNFNQSPPEIVEFAFG